MKKNLTIFTTLLFLFSCSNNEITDISHIKKDNNISFKTLRNKVTTRHANDNRSTYRLYSVIDNTDTWYFNTVVTPNSDETVGSIDTCANTYYWPGTTEVTFYAYAPSETADSTGIITVTDTYPDLTIDYKVPAS